MAESNIHIQLDTVRKNNIKLIYAVQHDYGARYLTVEMTSDGKAEKVSPTAAVSINAKRSDGRKNAFSGVVNADGTVTVPVTDWMLDVEGEVVCSVAVVESGKRLTTTHFYMQAQESVWDGTSAPSDDDPNRDVILEIIASENVRVSNENARISAENSRKTAETARADAESARITNEGVRVDNEAERVSAESVRKTEFASWHGAIGKISSFDKRIENLEAAVSPGLVTPMVDDSVAYIKNVPIDALPYAEITEIGGMTYNDNGVLRDAKVTALKSVGVNIWDEQWKVATNDSGTEVFANATRIPVKPNTKYFYTGTENMSNALRFVDKDGKYITQIYPSANSSFTTPSNCAYINFKLAGSYGLEYKHDICINEYNEAINGTYYPYREPQSFTIPDVVQNLDGYGQGISKEYNNKIVLDPAEGVKKFHAVVGEVTFDGSSDEAWSLYEGGKNVGFSIPLYKMMMNGRKNGIASYSHLVTQTSPVNSDIDGITFGTTDNRNIYITQSNAVYSTLAEWKAHLAENPLTVCYLLNSPTETDLSDYFGDDNFIEVEGGGAITAVNEYKYAIPSVIEYTVKGSDVT